jgi:hypothetical protein
MAIALAVSATIVLGEAEDAHLSEVAMPLFFRGGYGIAAA